ncbi:hypothetical protein ACIFQM_11220 [Paenibacillus sp. NRS-1782]|uniref:hypothetical protein n=1 Tax=unclassified Paenibacillus TaxID=185978 RepID=UPI003D2CDFCE
MDVLNTSGGVPITEFTDSSRQSHRDGRGAYGDGTSINYSSSRRLRVVLGVRDSRGYTIGGALYGRYGNVN